MENDGALALAPALEHLRQLQHLSLITNEVGCKLKILADLKFYITYTLQNSNYVQAPLSIICIHPMLQVDDGLMNQQHSQSDAWGRKAGQVMAALENPGDCLTPPECGQGTVSLASIRPL